MLNSWRANVGAGGSATEALWRNFDAALREECGESAFARLTRDTAARVAKARDAAVSVDSKERRTGASSGLLSRKLPEERLSERARELSTPVDSAARSDKAREKEVQELAKRSPGSGRGKRRGSPGSGRKSQPRTPDGGGASLRLVPASASSAGAEDDVDWERRELRVELLEPQPEPEVGRVMSVEDEAAAWSSRAAALQREAGA